MPMGQGYARPCASFDGLSAGWTWVALAFTASALVIADRAFPDVGMGPAYIPLIALAGWRLGLPPACGVALVAAFLNIFPHYVEEVASPTVTVARGVLRLGTYAFIVALVCALRRLYDRERTAARRDHLTGALARAAFEERASVLTSPPARGRGAVAMILIDVDGFKAINDRHGHAAGDRTLQTLVRTAASNLFRGDCLGRLGGDEFAAILHAATVDEACARVERFQHVVSDGLARADVPVTASMGACVLAPGVCADTADVMRVADGSMYEAKASRSGAVRIDALPLSQTGGTPEPSRKDRLASRVFQVVGRSD